MCVIVNSGNQLTIIVILGWCTESLKTGNRTCFSAEVSQSTAFETPSAEQLGTEYSWTSEERRQKVNAIRGMRAMER